MSTITRLLILPSIFLLYSSMLVFGIGTSCLFAAGLICVADLTSFCGPFVDVFSGNKKTQTVISSLYVIMSMQNEARVFSYLCWLHLQND